MGQGGHDPGEAREPRVLGTVRRGPWERISYGMAGRYADVFRYAIVLLPDLPRRSVSLNIAPEIQIQI